jgi:hypothetical protein
VHARFAAASSDKLGKSGTKSGVLLKIHLVENEAFQVDEMDIVKLFKDVGKELSVKWRVEIEFSR